MSDVDFTQDSPFPAQQASFNSMRNVKARNRAGWLALFAEDALLQDPVGVSPFDPSGLGHKGKEAIGAFWDNVIEPNGGTFRIRESYPAADECANVITLGRTLPNGKQLDVHFVGVYRVNEAGRIVSLKAYWQFDKVAAEFAAAMAD
jgi:ketosteroid isomerase-like protein